MQLDAANFRRSIVAEDGWVIPTGRRARPGSAGGRPAELFRPGRAWKHGGPIHLPRTEEGMSPCEQLSTTGTAARSPPNRRGRAARSEGRRGSRQDPCHHGQPYGLRLAPGQAVLLPLLHRPAPPEGADPRHRARRGGRSRRGCGDRVRGRRPGLRLHRLRRHAEFACERESPPLARMRRPASASRRRLRSATERSSPWPAWRRSTFDRARSSLRRLRRDRDRSECSSPGARRRRDGRGQHEEPRARQVTRGRRVIDYLRRTSRGTARPTTSSSTRSASTRSVAAAIR